MGFGIFTARGRAQLPEALGVRASEVTWGRGALSEKHGHLDLRNIGGKELDLLSEPPLFAP